MNLSPSIFSCIIISLVLHLVLLSFPYYYAHLCTYVFNAYAITGRYPCTDLYVQACMLYHNLYLYRNCYTYSHMHFCTQICTPKARNAYSVTNVVPSVCFKTFLYRHLKLSKTLENSLCYCYTSYEMTDQFL